MTEVENLNYDCNYNIFLVKMMISNLEKSDQTLVLRWIRKLSSCSRNIEEMRERNEYMYNLVLNVQNGLLECPFSCPPPAGPLKSALEFWPLPEQTEKEIETEISAGTCGLPIRDLNPIKNTPSSSHAIRTPRGGSFAVPHPLPRCGAYFLMDVFCDK